MGDIIDIAVSQLGITQSSGGQKKYNDYVDMSALSPWCHAFASWCAKESGMGTGSFPKTASTTEGMNWFKNNGAFKGKSGYTPKRGDVIYFKTGASHVGLVESCSGGSVTTIEGNSGARSCVERYTYPLSYATITGYGIPAYGSASAGNISGSSSAGGVSDGKEYDPSAEIAQLNSLLARVETAQKSEVIEAEAEPVNKAPELKIWVIINGDKPSATAILVPDDLQVTYERVGTPGKLTFKTFIDPENPIAEGDRVSVRVDGNILFVGYVFTIQRDKDETISITAYNQIRYLKNKDTRVYSKMSASELLRAIAFDFKLETGEIDNTVFKMSRIEDNTTLIDMLLNALYETFTATGEIYTLFDKEGKLSLKNMKKMKLDNCLVCKDTARDYSYKTSIDSDVYNQVKLVYDNGETGSYDAYITKDTSNIEKWGVLQYFEKIKHPALGAIKSEVLLKAYNRVARNLTLEGVIGNADTIAGCLIPIILDLGDLAIKNFMLVEKVTHKIKNNEYFMDLIVSGGDFVV